MIVSKALTISLTYKTTTILSMCDTAENIARTVKHMLEDEQFDSYMHIVTKDLIVGIENIDEQNVELLVTMFTTIDSTGNIKPRRLLTAYVDSKLSEFNSHELTAKLVRRKTY